MIGTLVFSAFFGFLAAAILNQIFRHVLRFRAEWTSTFIACMLTCLVSGAAFLCAGLTFEKTSEWATLQVLGTTFAITFVAGLLAFRLIIRSESGRSLPWPMSAVVSFALSLPPIVLLSVLSMVIADF